MRPFFDKMCVVVYLLYAESGHRKNIYSQYTYSDKLSILYVYYEA